MAKKQKPTSMYIPETTTLKWNAGEDHDGTIKFIELPENYVEENIVIDGFDSLDDVKNRLFLDTILQKLKAKHKWQHDTPLDAIHKDVANTKIRLAVQEFPVISISGWIEDNSEKLPFLKDMPKDNVRDMIRAAFPSHILVD